MRKLIFGFLWLLGCSSSLAQQTRLLTDGAPIKLVGVIALERRGNNAYIVIKTIEPYEAIFDANDRRSVREIGLNLDGQGDSLKALIGQKVSVVGKVQLEPASPYYLNGTLIVAKSVQLANGYVLTPKPQVSSALSADLPRFYTLVTFTPQGSQRFAYKTWDGQGHPLSSSHEYVSCGLNGSGEVMNCFCPKKFIFSGKGKVISGHFTKIASPEDGFDFAQYEIADPVRHSVQEAIECTRRVNQ